MVHEDDSESEIIQLVNIFLTYQLDRFQYSRADTMGIRRNNDLHTCKMEHEDGSESKIVQLVKKTLSVI